MDARNRLVILFLYQDDATGCADRVRETFDVDPLAAEQIGLSCPSGPAAVSAKGGIDEGDNSRGICWRGRPCDQIDRHVTIVSSLHALRSSDRKNKGPRT